MSPLKSSKRGTDEYEISLQSADAWDVAKHEKNWKDFPLDSFILSFDYRKYEYATDEKYDEFLNEFDVIWLFRAWRALHGKLPEIEAENRYLSDFFQHTDPVLHKMLTSEKKMTPKKNTFKKIASEVTRKLDDDSEKEQETKSKYDIGTILRNADKISTNRKSGISVLYNFNLSEYNLNYKTRITMTDHSCYLLTKNFEDMEKTSKKTFQIFASRIEELIISRNETKNTENTFKKTFLYYDDDIAFLSKASENKLFQYLRNFINGWIRNAKSLRNDLRLKQSNLQRQTKSLQFEYAQKLELSKIVSVYDFELMYLKKADSLRALKDETISLTALKTLTGQATLNMTDEKRLLHIFHIAINEKIEEVDAEMKKIKRLKKDIRKTEDKNIIRKAELLNLLDLANQYSAPTIDEYVKLKQLEILAIKEQGLLHRKLNILLLQAKNIAVKKRKKIV